MMPSDKNLPEGFEKPSIIDPSNQVRTRPRRAVLVSRRQCSTNEEQVVQSIPEELEILTSLYTGRNLGMHGEHGISS